MSKQRPHRCQQKPLLVRLSAGDGAPDTKKDSVSTHHPMTHVPGDGSLPLAGVVVADLSRVLAGPYATMLLADMGATVIKVESLLGDETRSWRPPTFQGESTYFQGVNRNKFSIALDFRDLADRQILHDLLSVSDVVVENFKPGSLKTFDLDPLTVRGTHPELIWASITGFGSGDGADLPGYDLVAQAVSGWMDLTGSPDGPPTKVGVAAIDVITGLHALSGILAALYRRGSTGQGEYLEVNLLSSALSGLVNQSSAAATGHFPTRLGNEHPSLTPYEVYSASDRTLVIAVGNDTQFAKLMTVLGRDELASDSRFFTMEARNLHRADLRTLINDVLSTRLAHDVVDTLIAEGIPAGVVNTVAEGIRVAEKLGLNPVVTPGSTPTIAHPVTYQGSPVVYHRDPPGLNADRDEVLRFIAQKISS
jgi:crotonobetainyl-CoA:carnitine CoA-transferase CaiB-like acyl-CoA transferase